MQKETTNLEFHVARKVLALANRIVITRNNHLKELELTAEQADTLLFFFQHENATISDLKDYLRIRHQTASGIVSRLAEKGLLSLTTSDADARAKIVRLTEQGMSIIHILQENGMHTGYNLLKDMDKNEQIQFVNLVEKALKNV